MNHYTELLYYIKSLGDNDPFINTVTQGEFDRLDLDKSNIFPLLHINITSGGFTNGQTVSFNVEIGALDIRDINKEILTDKFWLQDNEVDNLNTMHSVLNRLWLNMYNNFQENNIIATENPSLEIVTEHGKNLLDGWILNFDVEMPNTIISLCSNETQGVFGFSFDETFN